MCMCVCVYFKIENRDMEDARAESHNSVGVVSVCVSRSVCMCHTGCAHQGCVCGIKGVHHTACVTGFSVCVCVTLRALQGVVCVCVSHRVRFRA